MLQRPENLELLAEYSVASRIAPQFAETVDVLEPFLNRTTKGAGDLNGRFGREMMQILCGQDYPFDDELLAQYTFQFGRAVALTRVLTTASDPRSVLDAITWPRPLEEGLIFKIYRSWGAVNYLEKQALGEGEDIPFYLRIKRTASILTGRAITRTRLEEAVGFLEEYFSEPSNIKYIRNLAEHVGNSDPLLTTFLPEAG